MSEIIGKGQIMTTLKEILEDPNFKPVYSALNAEFREAAGRLYCILPPKNPEAMLTHAVHKREVSVFDYKTQQRTKNTVETTNDFNEGTRAARIVEFNLNECAQSAGEVYKTTFGTKLDDVTIAEPALIIKCPAGVSEDKAKCNINWALIL